MRTIKQVNYKGEECLLKQNFYQNGRIALFLVSVEGELISTCTTNIPEIPLDDDEVFIKDYSENEGILEFLVKEGIVKDTGQVLLSGYVKIPVCRLQKNAIK